MKEPAIDNKELILALEDLEKEKGIKKEYLLESIETALLTAYKRNFDALDNVRIEMDKKTGATHVYSIKEAVEKVENDKTQIQLKEAKKINPEVEEGGTVEIEIVPRNFGRIAAQTAKQVIIQKLRELEREIIFTEYNDRKGEIVTGLIQKADKSIVVMDLGKLEGVMPHKEQIHWRHFNVLPPKNSSYSMTTYNRWFAAIPTDCSIAPDLVFKHLYVQTNNKWEKKYGWPLFKELAVDDQYHFETLHLMGQNNDQKEFDGLIQSITKLVIDSLNEKQLVKGIDCNKPDVIQLLTEKNIKELKPSNIQGGITKFECFLISEGVLNSDFVKLLREIQELRSCTVAHRKSTKLDSKTESLFNFFGILQNSDKIVLSNLLSRLNEMLKWLISIAK